MPSLGIVDQAMSLVLMGDSRLWLRGSRISSGATLYARTRAVALYVVGGCRQLLLGRRVRRRISAPAEGAVDVDRQLSSS